jgi:hypothetical protein
MLRKRRFLMIDNRLCFGEDFLRLPRLISGLHAPANERAARLNQKSVVWARSSRGEGRADARSHSIPVALTEMADYA